MVTERLIVLAGTALLVACGGVAPTAPAGTQAPQLAAGSADADAGPVTAPPLAAAPARATEGLLELGVGSGVPSFLGAIHAVVTDDSGEVLGGADEDVAEPELAAERSLQVLLPAGQGYRVELSAVTTDAEPASCTARIDALAITAGSTARAQVFSWNCDGVSGYVPSGVSGECYWLADWTLVARTSASVGDAIDVSAAARGLSGGQPTFSWSTATSEAGGFDDASEPSAAFRCRAEAQDVPLTLTLSDGDCTQRVTQVVSCVAL